MDKLFLRYTKNLIIQNYLKRSKNVPSNPQNSELFLRAKLLFFPGKSTHKYPYLILKNTK